MTASAASHGKRSKQAPTSSHSATQRVRPRLDKWAKLSIWSVPLRETNCAPRTSTTQRGLGLANTLIALQHGIREFDSSLAGLGGCPHAPGATGNVNSEDLVYMLQSMGYETGIDIEKLIASRSVLEQALPGEPLYGYLARAGVPSQFHESKAAR